MAKNRNASNKNRPHITNLKIMKTISLLANQNDRGAWKPHTDTHTRPENHTNYFRPNSLAGKHTCILCENGWSHRGKAQSGGRRAGEFFIIIFLIALAPRGERQPAER